MLTFTTPGHETTALNRRESLLHYLENPLQAPEAPSGHLPTGRAKTEYDQQRLDYLSGGIVLHTQAVLGAKLQLTRAFQENRARNSGHAGVMLSGESTVGKTTTAKRVMRWVLGEYAKQVPDWRSYEQVPVMYVEVPWDSSGKALLQDMAAFFGLSVSRRDTSADLRNKVVGAIRRARTQLIVVDELQNLAASNKAGLGETVDLLKGLHNDVSSTFMYCGVDLLRSSLMNGARGQQLKNRFSVVELSAYKWSNPDHRRQWKRLVRGFEENLLLRDHKVGTLDAELQYLWERTGGSIGSVGKRLTGTTIELINEGAELETLDRARLDAYKLDINAENHYEKVRERLTGRRKSATEKLMAS